MRRDREEIVKTLEDSEVAKVSIRDWRNKSSSAKESRINIVRIARQARNEKTQIVSSLVWRDGMNN